MSDRSKRLKEIGEYKQATGTIVKILVKPSDYEWICSEIRSLEKKLEIAKEALMNHIPPKGQAFKLDTFYDGYLAREALKAIEEK